MSHFILVKDSHPSDVRFRKVLSVLSDRLLADSKSTSYYWDRFRSSFRLLSPQIKYVPLFHIFSSSAFCFSQVALAAYPFRLCVTLVVFDLFKGETTIFYCADFLAALPCSFGSFSCRCKLIYDVYMKLVSFFPIASFVFYFYALILASSGADYIVKVASNRIPYSSKLMLKRPQFGLRVCGCHLKLLHFSGFRFYPKIIFSKLELLTSGITDFHLHGRIVLLVIM